MPTIQNDQVSVQLDDRWPRTVRLTRVASGRSVRGCDPQRPFELELNGQRYAQDQIACQVQASATAADYRVTVSSLGLTLVFRFALEGNALVVTLPEVKETGAFRLETLYVPEHRLVTGTAEGGDWFLRQITRRTNWSRHYVPGTGTYDKWEDWGTVGGATPERGAQYTDHACVWNDGLCVAVLCSVHVEPLVSCLDAAGSIKPARAGQFSVWAGTWHYRLRGHLAEPFALRIGLLGDYNGNGKIDWCDAACWEADQYPKPDAMYREAVIYKIHIDHERDEFCRRTFADALEVIKMMHQICGGLKQIVYCTGWQYRGHDTGYPSLAVVNERAGGRDAFVKLIQEAKQYNAVVSMHINYDSVWPTHPEYRADVASQDADGKPFLWYISPIEGGTFEGSANHTLDVESGFAQDRLDRLVKMLPLTESIHLDAFRPYSEVWLKDGAHIGAECEVQRGMIPIIRMFREKGLDISTEDSDDEKRGLFSWVWHQPDWKQMYKTALNHGVVLGRGRAWLGSGGKDDARVEGVALGLGLVTVDDVFDYGRAVDSFYRHWMYSQILARKRMTGYRVGDWGFGVRAWYQDHTHVHAEYWPHLLEATYEGIPIARNFDRFLPWRDDVIYAYSKEGGSQEWTLPEAWTGARITAEMLRIGGTMPFADFKVEGRTIRFRAPAGMPIRFTRP